MSSDDLPIRLAAAYAASPECAAPERLFAAASGELADDERQAIERHAAACPACAAELELARAFAPSAEELDAARGEIGAIVERLRRTNPAAPPAARVLRFEKAAAPAAWTPTSRRFALAATLLVAAGSLFLLARARDAAPGLPAPSDREVVRSARIETLAPAGELGTSPERFVWLAVDGARDYRVELLGVDDSSLWSGASALPSIELPADLRARLAPAVRYRWRVEALAPTGEVLGRSEATEFLIAPPAPRI